MESLLHRSNIWKQAYIYLIFIWNNAIIKDPQFLCFRHALVSWLLCSSTVLSMRLHFDSPFWQTLSVMDKVEEASDFLTFFSLPVCLSVVWPPSIWPLGWFYYPNAYGNADKVGPSCLTRRLNNFNNAKWDIPTCEGYARSHSIPGSRGPRKYFRIVHECKYIFGAVSHLARSIRFLRESQATRDESKIPKRKWGSGKLLPLVRQMQCIFPAKLKIMYVNARLYLLMCSFT